MRAQKLVEELEELEEWPIGYRSPSIYRPLVHELPGFVVPLALGKADRGLPRGA